MTQRIAGVRSALEQNDAAAIRAAADQLNEAMQRLGSAVYSQGGATMGGGETPPHGNDEGTVEGEFREV